MSDETRSPGFGHVLDLVIEEALDNARSMLPGRVTAYDEERQCVSVQPLIKAGHINADGDREVEALPEVHEVPVWFLGAQAGGRITVPVAKGDTGMIVFASMSIARWKLKGGLVDPDDDVRHLPDSCFFMPGGHDFAHVPTTAPTDAICTHGKTKLGGPTGTQPTLMADRFLTALDTLIAAIGTAVGTVPGGTAGAADIGTALTTFKSALVRDAYKTSETEVK